MIERYKGIPFFGEIIFWTWQGSVTRKSSEFSPSHGRGASDSRKVPGVLTRGAQYPTRKMTWKAFVRTTRISIYALSLKIRYIYSLNYKTVEAIHRGGLASSVVELFFFLTGGVGYGYMVLLTQAKESDPR